jgi:hypothetical protein
MPSKCFNFGALNAYSSVKISRSALVFLIALSPSLHTKNKSTKIHSHCTQLPIHFSKVSLGACVDFSRHFMFGLPKFLFSYFVRSVFLHWPL